MKMKSPAISITASVIAIVIVLSIYSTATASKPSAIIVLGGDEEETKRPSSNIANIVEDVVSVRTARKRSVVTFDKIKLHSSAKIEEKKRALKAIQANSLTPSVLSRKPPLGRRIVDSFQKHIEGVTRTVKGIGGKKHGAVNKKKVAKLNTDVRTAARNNNNYNNNLKTKVRTGSANGKENRAQGDKKANLKASVRNKVKKAAKKNELKAKIRTSRSAGKVGRAQKGNKVDLKANVRTKIVKAAKKNVLKTKIRAISASGAGKVKRDVAEKKRTNLKASVRSKTGKAAKTKTGNDLSSMKTTAKIAGCGHSKDNLNLKTNVVHVVRKAASIALKTSVHSEATETLTHREKHYEYTSVYPPTCQCTLGIGLAPGDCWHYTDKTRTKCESRQCAQSWVCVVGESTGRTCIRKKSFHKIVPDASGDTCSTKEHIAYSYVPYS